MGGLREAILCSCTTTTTYCCCLLLNGAWLWLRGVPGTDWLGYLCRMSATKQVLLSHGFLDTIDLQLITTTPIHSIQEHEPWLIPIFKQPGCWYSLPVSPAYHSRLPQPRNKPIIKTTAPPRHTTWTQKLALCHPLFHASFVCFHMFLRIYDAFNIPQFLAVWLRCAHNSNWTFSVSLWFTTYDNV